MKKFFRISVVIVISISLLVIGLPRILNSMGLNPEYEGQSVELINKRALIITTSHSVLSKADEIKGKKTGVWGAEMTHPYYTFLDGGMEVDIASIQGGTIPIDPDSFSYFVISPEDKRYLEDPVAQAKANNSIPISEVDIKEYGIIFIAGGWGAAYDLAQSSVLAEKITESYYSIKNPIIGGVCHGVLGLVNARDREGNLLISGRVMTGVTDKQIDELGINFTPKHPETELRKAGTIFESQSAFRDIFATHVSVDIDKRFVTGQNQNSGLETAHTMMRLISMRN